MTDEHFWGDVETAVVAHAHDRAWDEETDLAPVLAGIRNRRAALEDARAQTALDAWVLGGHRSYNLIQGSPAIEGGCRLVLREWVNRRAQPVDIFHAASPAEARAKAAAWVRER